MIAILFLVGMFSCLVSLTQVNKTFGVGLPSPMETFIAKQAGFSIKHPHSWQAHETPNGNHGDTDVIGVISRIAFSSPIVTIARSKSANGDMNSVAEWGKVRINEHNPYAEYHVIAVEPLKSKTYAGIMREYYLEEPTLIATVIRHCQDWYFLDKNTGYSLSFCVNDCDWPQVKDVFGEMMQSFVITGH